MASMSQQQQALCNKAWAAYAKKPGDSLKLKKLANELGLNKNMVLKYPPESLEQLIDRCSHRWYEDMSAGASENIQTCMARAGAHGILESAEGKYSKMLREHDLIAVVTAHCKGIFQSGVKPLDMIHAWNEESGRGQQVASPCQDEGYLVSLEAYYTDDFDVAREVLSRMINACAKPCAILCIWAEEDGATKTHALSVKSVPSSEKKAIKAIDRAQRGRQHLVMEDAFVQLVIVDAKITITSSGDEPEEDDDYEDAMHFASQRMRKSTPPPAEAMSALAERGRRALEEEAESQRMRQQLARVEERAREGLSQSRPVDQPSSAAPAAAQHIHQDVKDSNLVQISGTNTGPMNFGPRYVTHQAPASVVDVRGRDNVVGNNNYVRR